jgi:Uma2 family endonuclease
MTTAIADTSSLMTTEQLLALPDDGVDRDLIRGKLVEKSITRRNRRHSRTEANFAFLLKGWLETQSEPRGEVLCGEAGFRLRSDPDTTVGVDVAYISAETAELTPEDAFIIEGTPILVVQILSPSNEQEDILDKVREYLYCGVKLVWLAEPVFRTITVFSLMPSRRCSIRHRRTVPAGFSDAGGGGVCQVEAVASDIAKVCQRRKDW